VARFDFDSAPASEPQVDAGWLAAFEAELNRQILAGVFDVPLNGVATRAGPTATRRREQSCNHS
jgi:hypothetical protein